MSDFTSEIFLETLGQYLGLSEEESKSKGSILDALAPAPDEDSIKQELRTEYGDVLNTLQEQTKGYGAGVKEAISSQQRQELAQAARRTGGSQRMLSGRTKAAALAGAQIQNKQAQSTVLYETEREENKFKEQAKTDLNKLEMDLGTFAQKRADDMRSQRLKTGLSLYQLLELAKRNDKGT